MKYLKKFESKKDILRDKLIDAITFGNEKDFNFLLNKHFYKDKSFGNLYSINFVNDDGYTPLTSAIENDRLDMLKKLIDFGANVNYKDGQLANTPLMIAAQQNSLGILQILIRADADWNIKDLSNNDFFDYLTDDKKEIIIEDYPEKYKDYLIKKEAEKYNI